MTAATFEPVSIGKHPQLNESRVQKKIAADPAMLGLGESMPQVLKARRVSRAGARSR
jgi:hypothetical protein